MKISFEELVILNDKINKIKNTKLEDLEIYCNGEKVNISNDILDEWNCYINVDNLDFILLKFWENKFLRGV